MFLLIVALIIISLYQVLLSIGLLLSLSGLLLLVSICGFEIKYTAKKRRDSQALATETLNLEKAKKAFTGIDIYLTSLNDKEAVTQMIMEFRKSEFCGQIYVIDNGSTDGTVESSETLGANVIIEKLPGYGRVMYRSLSEGCSRDTEWFAICEGDGTYKATDLEKLMSYRNSAAIINGTRIVEQLREELTQLSDFIFWGNFFAAKILELKHFGRGTFTDLGTTYKLLNAKAVKPLLKDLNPEINLEFNAHFLDVALSKEIRIVEVPIHFRKRVGQSKGGSSSTRKAILVGIRMMWGILFRWPK